MKLHRLHCSLHLEFHRSDILQIHTLPDMEAWTTSYQSGSHGFQ